MSQAQITAVPGIDFLWEAVGISSSNAPAAGTDLNGVANLPTLRKGVWLVEYEMVCDDPTAGVVSLVQLVQRDALGNDRQLARHMIGFSTPIPIQGLKGRTVFRIDVDGGRIVLRSVGAFPVGSTVLTTLRILFLQD